MNPNPASKPEGYDIVARIKEEKRKFEQHADAWRKEARENYDMVAGEGRQWSKEDRAKLREQNRPCVEFNRLGSIVDAVSGSEVNNRQETTYIPRIAGDAKSQMIGFGRTAAARWVKDNCDAEDEESDAFVDVLISGMGFTETRMDYEEDEEGQVLIERKDPLRMGWDASARKRNLSDARCIWEDCKLTRDEINARWPDKAQEIAASPQEDDDDEDGEEHIVNPRTAYSGDNSSTGGSDLVTVTHYQWFEVDQIYKVLDPGSGQIMELPEDRFQVAKAVMPGIQAAKVPRRRYMRAFVAGGIELEVGPGPCKHAFSLQAITGKRDRNMGTWYGLVRPMKDPQRWANKFFSQILHIINTNAKGGVLVEQGATADIKKFEDNWARSDAVTLLNSGGLQKIQPKQPANIPPSLFQMMDFAISSIRDGSGVNLELLGMVDRQQAGILEQQRTRAGLTILAPFFDSLRLYRKRHGRLLAYFIQEYISDGRLIRVMGPQGEQIIPLLKLPEDIDMDVVVDSAPTARDTKEQTWAALMPIIQMMGGQGIQPPPEVLDYLPVPQSLAQKLKEAYIQAMGQRQQDTSQKDMQQAQLANERADAELKEAGAAEKYFKAGQAGITALQMLFGPQPAGAGTQQPMQQPGQMPSPTIQ